MNAPDIFQISVDAASAAGVDFLLLIDGTSLDEFITPGESKDLGNGVTLIRRI